jgi:two-component system, OmpR family, sensor histidine kinase KdpD
VRRRLRIGEYGWAISIIGLTTGIALVIRPYLQTIDIAMLFLLAVVVVAYRHSRGPAVVASLFSIAAFDFGFVAPFYTFNVHNTAFFLTFAVMLGVALSMTQLTGRIREQIEEANEREEQATALYSLSQGLAAAASIQDQIAVVKKHLASAADGECLILLNAADSGFESGCWPELEGSDNVAVRVVARWAYDTGESAGWGTSHGAEVEALVIPLRGSAGCIGVVIVRPRAPDDLLPPKRLRLVEALLAQAAVAFERAQWAERHDRARVEVESERLRTALLSSLSHDLRTPLGSIEGAASSLLEDSSATPGTIQREMAETILEESRRMNRLVTNLLDMVRVETGALAVQKAWQPLEEALGVALLRLDERLSAHPVRTRLAPDLPLVPIDELLIEQVFINLLENAAKHTPPGTPITVSAWGANGSVVVEVADAGPGVPSGEEETIFRKFHRAASTDRLSPAGGCGLGLTICRGIITAHGGRVWLHRHAGAGAAFRFSLPLDGPPLRALPEQVLEGAG